MLRNSFIALLLALLIGVMLPEGALAQPANHTPGWNPQNSNSNFCAGYTNESGAYVAYSGFSGRVVNCVKNTVVNASRGFLKAVYAFFSPVIFVVIVLSMIFYGIMLIGGQLRAPLRDTFILLFKIVAVLMATRYFTEIYEAIIAASENLLNIVSTATTRSLQANCGGDVSDVWARADCAVEHIIGIALRRNTVLVGGITALVTAFLFTASWGIFISLLAIAIIYFLIMTIAEAIYIYLNAFIALACLAMLAPMFIPMVLFQYTKLMFDKWFKMALSFTLQPMFLFAYLSLLLTAFDTTVLYGEKSLYTSITGNRLQPGQNFSIGDYFIHNGLYLDQTWYPLCVNTKPSTEHVREAVVQPSKVTGPFVAYANKFAAQGLCDVSSQIGIGLHYKAIDMEKWGKLHDPDLTPQQLFKQIFVAFAMAALIAYVMQATLGYIPMLGTEVAGGLMDGVNLGRVGRMPSAGAIGGLK